MSLTVSVVESLFASLVSGDIAGFFNHSVSRYSLTSPPLTLAQGGRERHLDHCIANVQDLLDIGQARRLALCCYDLG